MEYSLREVANLLLSFSQRESSPIHKPLPEDEPKRSCPDISRARESYGLGAAGLGQGGLRSTYKVVCEAQGRCTPLAVGG
jgi:hypothetical protein